MAVTESFLVNTNSFNPIIEALIERDEAPEEITDELFASMGFESPSELLVIHMLKELNMLTVEGKPTELYHELTNPDTTDEALAEGIFHAYTDLFKQNKEFYKLQKEDIYKALEEYFEGRKTELILKYMTNTFHKLVSYAGLNNMQKAVDEHLKEEETEELQTNGQAESAAEIDADSETEDKEAQASASAEEVEDIEEQDTDTEEIVSEEPAAEIEEDDDEADFVESETEEVQAQDNEEDDEEFDAVFFSEEQDSVTEEEEAPEISPSGKKKGSINFDELPKVQREEKGSESIDEFLNAGTNEEESEELEQETAEAESEEDISSTNTSTEDQDTEEEAVTDQKEKESLSDQQKETLEKELMEIDMESTNGLHKNGADNAEKPMANLSNVPTKEKVEKALIKKAELLYKLERFEDVLPAYKDVISYFDGSDKDHLQEAVAKAVINRVSVLKKLNKDDELLPALEEVISRFEDSSVNEYYENASLAMLDKAQLLEDASAEDLMPLYNAIIDRLRNASTPKIKTQVDDIFVKRVDLLTENGPEQKLLDAVDELIERFEGSQTHTGQLEQAMYKKAEVLENLGRDEEALEAYSEFLDTFGKTKEMV